MGRRYELYIFSLNGKTIVVVEELLIFINEDYDIKECISILADLYGNNLYGLLGMELHCQQQGVSSVFYKGSRMVPVRMEDTAGVIRRTTEVSFPEKEGACVTTIGELFDDGELVYPETVTVV